MAPRGSRTATKPAEDTAPDPTPEAVKVDEADANAETNGEGGEAGEASTTGNKRPMPTYALSEALDDLPGEAPRLTRDKMFLGLLQPIVDDEDNWGKWFAVATYKTPTGAREAQKAVEKGERELPDGVWEHAIRKIEPTEPSNHSRFSVLYFRYMGAADAE
jgi:hypothetical protein